MPPVRKRFDGNGEVLSWHGALLGSMTRHCIVLYLPGSHQSWYVLVEVSDPRGSDCMQHSRASLHAFLG